MQIRPPFCFSVFLWEDAKTRTQICKLGFKYMGKDLLKILFPMSPTFLPYHEKWQSYDHFKTSHNSNDIGLCYSIAFTLGFAWPRPNFYSPLSHLQTAPNLPLQAPHVLECYSLLLILPLNSFLDLWILRIPPKFLTKSHTLLATVLW